MSGKKLRLPSKNVPRIYPLAYISIQCCGVLRASLEEKRTCKKSLTFSSIILCELLQTVSW